MGSVQIQLDGKIKPLTGKDSQQLNKILREQILPIVVEQVTVDISSKAQEYAKGADTPAPTVAKVQARHRIGSSGSGYDSTGELAESIKVSYFSKIKSSISALAEHASWVEFGTGIFGKQGQPIVTPDRELMVFKYQGSIVSKYSTLGQAPNPFMRGSVWFINENLKDTIDRIQKRIRGKYK